MKVLSLLFLLTCSYLWAGNIVVPDYSFEQVTIGFFPGYNNGYLNSNALFSSPDWNFTGGSGVYTGTWFAGPPPDGTQAAFLQYNDSQVPGIPGIISQDLGGFIIGQQYFVTYYAAERPGGFPANPIDVSLGGVDLGTYTPTSTTFVQVTTQAMTATNTTMTLQFAGASGGCTSCDIDSAIDAVGVQSTPEPGMLAPAALGLGVLVMLRRRRSC